MSHSEILVAVLNKLQLPTPRFVAVLGGNSYVDGYNFATALEWQDEITTFPTYEEAWKAGMEEHPWLEKDGREVFINGAGGETCERTLMVADLNQFEQGNDGYWYKK